MEAKLSPFFIWIIPPEQTRQRWLNDGRIVCRNAISRNSCCRLGMAMAAAGRRAIILKTSYAKRIWRACLKCRWKARRNFLKIAHKTERRRIVMSANCISNVIGEHIRPKRRLNAATERASWPCARRKSGALRRRTNFHIQQKNLTAVGKMCCLTSFMIFCQEAALHACMRKPTSCIAKS